jgi:hypothetical protein
VRDGPYVDPNLPVPVARSMSPAAPPPPLNARAMVTPPAEPPWRYVKVNGTCPACGSTGTLFVGAYGYLTCGWLPCRDPLAASRLLEKPAPAAEDARPSPADALRDALRRNPPPFSAAAAEDGTDA